MSLIEALKAIHERMQDPKEWRGIGLCLAIKNEMFSRPSRDVYEACSKLRKIMACWPKFSGDDLFPIPGGAVAYHHLPDHFTVRAYMWDRENSAYAALRWELLEWCIARLEQQEAVKAQPEGQKKGG